MPARRFRSTGDINNAADITGRIAAFGQVTQATTIGSDLRTGDPYFDLASANGGPFAIVAAGGIPTSNSFNINAGGNVFSSTSTNATFNFVNEFYTGSLYMGSQLVTGGSSPLDFSTLQTRMLTLSGQLAGLGANGSICTVDNFGSMVPGNGCPSDPTYFNPASQHYNPSWLLLYGTSTTINVFNITQAEFRGDKNLDIEVPTGSTVIINVAGTSDTLQRDIYYQGNTATTPNSSNILFNFNGATSLTINGQIDAFVLAPQAYLSGGSQMSGIFVAASIGPTGEVHYYPFGGNLPGCSGQTVSQTISFSLSSPVTFVVAPIALSANATSGLPVTFGVASGPASVSGTTLTINGAGTVVVAANQAGNTTYAAAPPVTQTLVVNKAVPSVTMLPKASDIIYGQTLAASTLSGGTSTPSGTFQWTDPSIVPVPGTSTQSVTLVPTDATNYASAAVAVQITVGPSNPLPIFWTMEPTHTAAGLAFTLTVKGSGFVASSKVNFGGLELTPTSVSDIQLTVLVPAKQIASPGTTPAVSVLTPAPGGGTSDARLFQVDTAGTGVTTTPGFTTITATVSAGSSATYPLTLPSSATNVSAACLNLPPGTACSYSATAGAVTITTSPGMQKGTYQITVVFTEILPGAASSLVVLPFLLLPLLLFRRRMAKRGIWLSMGLLVALAVGVGVMNGCGGGGSLTTPPPEQTHQVKSSSTVTLTVQ